jgi:hypothetical protein
LVLFPAVPQCPQAAPTPSTIVEECPPFSLNFDNLVAGQYIHDELWMSHGVKITAIRKSSNKGYTPIDGIHNEAGGGAMVFDTLHPTGADGQSLCSNNDGDDDLGAPNSACPTPEGWVGPYPKPGKGPGGEPILSNGNPNPYMNCERLGNVLIIQESNKGCPDDTGNGGWINFDFRVPVDLKEAVILDIDEGVTPKIMLWYGNAQYKEIITPPTQNNGLWKQAIDLPEVTKMSIVYAGSGSIGELVYGFCPPSSLRAL